MLDLVGLSNADSVRVSEYSSGMRQRLAIARGMLSEPAVLILDEPTRSLDPEGARDIRESVREWCAAREATLVLATHDMLEAEQLVTHACILREGRVLHCEPVSQIVAVHGSLARLYTQVMKAPGGDHACA